MVVCFQVVSLLLAVVLGMMVSSEKKKKDDDVEEGSVSGSRGKAWEPLLNSNSNQASSSTSTSGGDAKAFKSDIWTSRIREKVLPSFSTFIRLLTSCF